ncbi:antibiotic biosynthesis monooxygenase [Geodermatophilus sabuli]|uniref:antibiotic biosynthesis monooxygenase n=1 Tax=Geodermatophilus sabuli TaxID=1564158 RepID=UPI0031F2D7D9
MAVTSLLRARWARSEVAGRRPEPVTVTVARVVRPHRRQAFERWAAEVLAVAATYPGNLGGTLLKPGPGSSEYHLVYRFRDDAALAAWERSAQRRDALERMQEMIDEERYARVAGLDSFFTRPAAPGPRWRSTVLTIGAVFLITSTLQVLVMPHLAGWAWPVRLLLSACVVVVLLGYVVMPTLTRLFAGWLHPRAD